MGISLPKRSVAELPIVGFISKCLGCVFVEREWKSPQYKNVSGIVTERVLAARQNKHAPLMMLFPEGTTSNGDFLLPFKTGAFLSKTPVLPVILRYPYQRFSPAWDSISGGNLILSNMGLPEKRIYHATLNGFFTNADLDLGPSTVHQ